MPSWKKVITSGSDASLNSLFVTTAVVADQLTGSLNIAETNTLGIGSQIFYPQGTNGFSVNEDYDASNSSTQTAYHFTSGVGRETVAFTLARTGQFTDGFGIYGTSADNTFVMFGEQNNTKFEWRRGVGIQPLGLNGGTLLATIDANGAVSASIFSGSFVGDGSGLTGISAGGGGIFAATGSYQSTTNNLQITGSLELYKSGSTVFSIEGSQGTLFAVTDVLSGSLFSVNDISGIPIFEVFSDDTVKIGTYNAEAIIVNGSSAIASGSFSGSFQGDGSGLTGLFSVTNETDNRVITSTGTSAGNAEANLTFDGSELGLSGDLVMAGGSIGVGVTPNATAGRIDASNDIVAYSSSDKRWKTNIKTIESPLDKLQKLSGVEFDWIEDTELHGNSGNDVGVIAQEVEEVLPQAVQTRDSGMKAVRYEKLIPLLIETIKEQQNQIDELKNKIG